MIALLQAGPVPLDFGDLALVALCVLINAVLSFAYRLGLGKPLAIASVRTLIQLFVIGQVLRAVFAVNAPLYVLGIVTLMALIAGHAITTRIEYRFPGALRIAIGSILFSSFLMTAYAVFVVVQPPQWSDPRYIIPLMGMVLGNSLTAMSLAMDRFATAMNERRAEIEAMLCFGAAPHEAVHTFTRDAIRTGMMPMINAMTVVGLVSLPGMMTGQILGGTPPEMAVRYQILVMFLLAASTALGSTISVLWSRRVLLDDRGRLRR